MRVRRRFFAGYFLAAVAMILASLQMGCGGGGGGGGATLTNRSFHFASATQTLNISIDANGRFTISASDTGSLSPGAGGQGSLASNGQFFAQSDDTTIQFAGTVASDGGSATGTVKRGSTTLIAFTATLVAAGSATPASLSGSYSGNAGGSVAYVTLDSTGHGTLFAGTGSTLGGAQVTVDSLGALQSADGSTVGQLTPSGGTYVLSLTKLNGTTLTFTLTVTKVTRAKWTFMVYLNGANDLQPFGPLNFNQMEKTGSTQDVNIVVQWKQASCATCGSPDWTGVRRYLVRKDDNTSVVNSPIVESLPVTTDMGDWRTLQSFIAWGQRNYPADHYAVVIWNHGAGWRDTRAAGSKLGNFPRSVSLDDAAHTEIQTWDLPQALNVTPKIDMLIFDASLMQMMEVAYEIRNQTGIIVGSEESPPGEGYVYDTFLNDLIASPTMTPAQLGAQIVNRTLDSYGSNTNLTQSEIDTSKLDGVATALDAFGNTLLNHIGDSRAIMQSARNSAQHYAYFDNKDLWDYAELIKNGSTNTDVKTAATNLQNAIAAARMAERHGTLNGNSHSLAIYVPDPTNYRSTYANLALARSTSWARWLQGQP